ncbi:MAG: CRTAC1 family protein [Vicinamibacterales bacterium]
MFKGAVFIAAGVTYTAAVLVPFDSLTLAQGRQAAVPFTEITHESGISFTHVNGATGELLLPEVIGSGGALFDYDNDGDLDLLAVQGKSLRADGTRHSPISRLYRNDLAAAADRRLRFTDVTEAAGLSVASYGMGAATGDYDNDGWVDVYVTGLGANHMLRNRGDGTFADVTASTGTRDTRWSTGAAFFDYDRDGWLDLFVTHYVDFGVDMRRACFAADSTRDYCNPAVYSPVADRLLHNNGNGTFSDVTPHAGLLRSPARGLGVLAADLNADGWLDLYVANDGDPNQLWINRGNGSFSDEALLAGAAVNRNGQAQGSMGVDLADVDGDGDEELFVTNLDNEGNTLYRSVGQVLYEDRTLEMGLFRLGFTGFGTRFVDYDNDSWLDLVVVNGAVRLSREQARRGDLFPLRQRNQLYRNDRGRRFMELTERAGAAFVPLHVARGLASGDLDNDGDTDLVVFNNSGPLRVLRNDVGQGQHWLGIRVLEGRRDALHARVALAGHTGPRVGRRVQVDGSYGTASDPRVIFGLAGDRSARSVRVDWANGRSEEFRDLAVDRYWMLEQGKPARAHPP